MKRLSASFEEEPYTYYATLFFMLLFVYIFSDSGLSLNETTIPTSVYAPLLMSSMMIFTIAICSVFFNRINRLSQMKHKAIKLLMLLVSYLSLLYICHHFVYLCTPLLILSLLKLLKTMLYKIFREDD